MSKKKITIFRTPKAKKVFAWLLSIFLVLILVGGYVYYFSNRVFPRTYISGISVSGLTKSQMQEKINEKNQAFLNQELTLQKDGLEWKVAPKDLAVEVSTSESMAQAYDYGKTANLWTRAKQYILALVNARYYEVNIKPIDDRKSEYLQGKFAVGIEKSYVETNLELKPGKVVVKEGKAGLQLDQSKLEEDLLAIYKNERTKDGEKDLQIILNLKQTQPLITDEQVDPLVKRAELLMAKPWTIKVGDQSYTFDSTKTVNWLNIDVSKNSADVIVDFKLGVNEKKIQADITEIAGKVDVKPTNASMKWENNLLSVDKEGVNGFTLLQSETLKSLENVLLEGSEIDYNIVADTNVTKPDLRSDTVAELGIKELIGTATTDYTGSPANRKFNIAKGQSSLNGGLLKDGEIYSTTTLLGPVDEASGYLPELVIKDNRTIPEAGGGLCQVSTTLFRAILNAGLPVTERTSHAYRVGYYERGVGPGLDATVYIPEPDLKWKNDTGHAILVQSFVLNNKITFNLFGTSDGRVSTIGAPVILEVNPVGDPIYIPTDTMYTDEKKQVETPHDGAKTTVLYTVMRDGKELNKQTFRSTYKPWPAQYLVGTKVRPVDATVTPTPTP